MEDAVLQSERGYSTVNLPDHAVASKMQTLKLCPKLSGAQRRKLWSQFIEPALEEPGATKMTDHKNQNQTPDTINKELLTRVSGTLQGIEGRKDSEETSPGNIMVKRPNLAHCLTTAGIVDPLTEGIHRRGLS